MRTAWYFAYHAPAARSASNSAGVRSVVVMGAATRRTLAVAPDAFLVDRADGALVAGF